MTHTTSNRPPAASAKYFDTPQFPANSALGCPHILYLAKYKPVSSSEKIHVADLIAIILHKHHPSTIDRFLNLGKNFAFKNGKGNGPDFLIIRKGKTAKVSIDRKNPFAAYLTHQIFSCEYGNMIGIFELEFGMTRETYADFDDMALHVCSTMSLTLLEPSSRLALSIVQIVILWLDYWR
ncbi:hypothetical protein ABVK25_009380 [Lepraria finkii]|uniref:Uncharacterized protein n=1 Tax=Lepraria finkii TaxID=1340010 RepID=A0ABR4B3N7_9LECA